MIKSGPVLFVALAVLAGGAIVAAANEALYARTPNGVIEVKEIPAVRMLETSSERGFYDRDSKLFMTLFRYIQKNDIPMTVPVESDLDAGNMRFLVPSKRVEEFPGETDVELRSRGVQQVVSVGLRGAYREKLARSGISKIERWLEEHPEYEADGQPYGVYWNSPFVPGFFKRSEVHLPVKPARPAAPQE